MKRSLAALLSGAVLLAPATACSSKGGSSDSVQETTASVTTAAPTETEPATEYEPHYIEPKDEDNSEKSMARAELLYSTPADEDGFIINGTTLLGYKGTEKVLHIPENITRIEDECLSGNETVEALYIPSSVREIGSMVCCNCASLRFVDIAEGTEKIGFLSFDNCSSLEDMNLPESLKDMFADTFFRIPEVKLHVPKGSYAETYAECERVSYDNDPAVYKAVSAENPIAAGQYRYEKFEEFIIPEGTDAIESEAFQYCERLESITIPSSVRYISPNAFEYCYGLKTVTIDGCREIRAEAFEYCKSLESVRINEGTASIGSYAFAYCESLKDVYLPASIEKISEDAFSNVGTNVTYHVPAGSYAEAFAKQENMNYDNNV